MRSFPIHLAAGTASLVFIERDSGSWRENVLDFSLFHDERRHEPDGIVLRLDETEARQAPLNLRGGEWRGR